MASHGLWRPFGMVILFVIYHSIDIAFVLFDQKTRIMIRKLKSAQYRIYSRKVDAKTNKRRNLGTFDSLEAAQKHERDIQYFKHH